MGDLGLPSRKTLTSKQTLGLYPALTSFMAFPGGGMISDATTETAEERHCPSSKGPCKHKHTLEDKLQDKQPTSFSLSSCKSCVFLTTLPNFSVSPKAAAMCQWAAAPSYEALQELHVLKQ